MYRCWVCIFVKMLVQVCIQVSEISKKPFDLQSRRIHKIDFVKKFATRDKTR